MIYVSLCIIVFCFSSLLSSLVNEWRFSKGTTVLKLFTQLCWCRDWLSPRALEGWQFLLQSRRVIKTVVSLPKRWLRKSKMRVPAGENLTSAEKNVWESSLDKLPPRYTTDRIGQRRGLPMEDVLHQHFLEHLQRFLLVEQSALSHSWW